MPFTMGYRLNERLPLINAAPNNEGLYKELFSTALEKINCKLVIVREPKRRIIKKLKNGNLDFYPGFTFSKERSNYVFFFENGSFALVNNLILLNGIKIKWIKSLESNAPSILWHEVSTIL